jgi:hypothetical protein
LSDARTTVGQTRTNHAVVNSFTEPMPTRCPRCEREVFVAAGRWDVPGLEEQFRIAWLSKQYQVPEVRLEEFHVAPEVIALVPRDLAERYGLIAVNRASPALVIAMADPADQEAIDAVREGSDLPVEVCVASPREISNAIVRYYGARDGLG